MNDSKKKWRVLVVDDHPKVLRFIEVTLKLQGYDVMTASSGEQALDMVNSTKPDIMLLDIVLSGIDGFQVLEKLRTFTHMPVIAVSASHANHDNALRSGADDFIPKPFRPDELNRRIEALLAP